MLVLCLATASFLILLRLAGFLSWWFAWSSRLIPVCIVSLFAGKGHLLGVDQPDPNNDSRVAGMSTFKNQQRESHQAEQLAQATQPRQCWMCGTKHVFVSFGGTCPAFGCVLIAEDTSRGGASTPPLPGGGVANIRLLNLDYKNCKIATQLR